VTATDRPSPSFGPPSEAPESGRRTGRQLLALDGQVDLAAYRAIFGSGGALDPATGTRLVACRRPGMELVVSPHKSVAELGVIGRVDDMHAIVDAERDATLAHRRAPVARCVLEDEQHIERLADELVSRSAPQLDADAAAAAISSTEAALGRPLTDTQRQLAAGLLTSDQPLDLVVGVAGLGKTTTLTAVKAGFEAAGYRVLGTATSGQAAHNLGSEAGVASRTVASLSWHLEHATLTLGRRDVVILDEGAMTTDADIGRLLAATACCEAKLIIVGDDRQLGAIGPAGALRALSERHPERTWQLTDNLHQRDPGEVAALEQLRARHVPAAVAWYARHGRLRPVPDWRSSVHHMVRAWAADVAAGRDSLLLAYRRDSVEALNQTARALLDRAGVLTGPEVVAPGGRYYRTGDRVVTLAPGPGGAWVTYQTAQVTAVDTTTGGLTVRTPDGRQLHFDRDATGADRLAHGYAMTAHRA